MCPAPHTVQQDAKGVGRLTGRQSLTGALKRLRGASASIKGLIIDRFEQGDTVPQDLIDIFWQIKEVEQSLVSVVQQGRQQRRAG